jgi:type IV secretory pathway ATPase VirB11/archaellum biosynthesis ATPase
MTAFGGGGRPSGGIPNPLSSVADPAAGDGGTGLRPLDQIFPLRGDANRSREMQATWRSFCRDRLEAVRAVLGAGRSPPEIAYQLGELLHNHFRTRGATLTSFELRRLVAELLVLHGPREAGPTEAGPAEAEREATSAPAAATPPPVVAFEGEPPKAPWPGDAPAPAQQPKVPAKALEPPPSPIVTVTPRDPEPAGVGEVGPIDRLWSDPAVRAIFVNGPRSVSVERNGTLQATGETFRDEAHLIESVTRLVGRPDGGMVDFRLRDGSTGFVIFPPAAPTGPVLTLRRADPGQATLEDLVSVGMLDRPVAELLRLCARSRLDMLVVGPHGSGKTALLAALVRTLDPALRVVTVANHRHFQATTASQVELVTQATAPFALLMSAASRLDPGMLVLDGVPLADAGTLSQRLKRGPAGILAAVAPEAMSALARSVDLVVRTDRIDGGPRVVAVEDSAGAAAFTLEGGKLARGKPAFAATLQARGLGDALAKWFA